MIENDENISRNYFAVIPAKVFNSKNISPSAKLIYALITSLTNEKGYCWASNKYFSDFFDVSERSVERYLKELENFGFIQIKINQNNERKIFIDFEPPKENLQVIEMPEKVISITSEDIKNFDEFYSAYPRQEAKNKALMAYKNALKRGASHKEIMDGVGRYTNYVADNNIDPLFVKLPATFLLNQDFKNEYKVQSIMDGIIK